ncbi:MAG: NAD(P)H-dependent oxidoreductase subunit E [Deltaproteobacteria bacterium]|jgi:NADH-quinone oxidoreductase subunit E|nr:NAD(P)H-dependent oxidoreductase subunit E [Deltaproteobacteria bacterium]
MPQAGDPNTAAFEGHERDPRELLPILLGIQARHRYLPEGELRAAAHYLSLPLARVFQVASFYRALSLKPKGETLVRVCCGTACHLRGAPQLIGGLEGLLGLRLGGTSADGRHSLESVNCLGACALAPVVTIGDEVYGKLTPDSLKGLPL